MQIEETTSDYDKEKLQERLAKLAGGVAVIRVGGATEVEVKERKDRVDDALHATRAAVEEALPGGGVALLRASEGLKKIRTQNDDQKTGVEIVRKALSWPARQIAINAGEDGSVIVGKILEKDQYSYGFDAQNNEYVNLVSKGIIDPTKVVQGGAAESSVDCWASNHHGSHGRRKAEEGKCSPRHARPWHGRYGRYGLLGVSPRPPKPMKARDLSGLFLSYLRPVAASTGFEGATAGASIGELDERGGCRFERRTGTHLMERAILRHPKNHVGRSTQMPRFRFGRRHTFSSHFLLVLVQVRR